MEGKDVSSKNAKTLTVSKWIFSILLLLLVIGWFIGNQTKEERKLKAFKVEETIQSALHRKLIVRIPQRYDTLDLIAIGTQLKREYNNSDILSV